MKKVLAFIAMLFLISSCFSGNKEGNNLTWTKEDAPRCSELAEWSNEQCKDDSYETNNNLGNNQNNEMKKIENKNNSYQTELPKDGDLVAIMKTTNGTFKIRLFKDDVPSVVNNFIWLASNWYYNWIIFHRVINNFMIQWWDPSGTWFWWASIYWEKFDDEFSDKLSNIRWSISMANSWPDTNGSQFFINQKDNINLDYDKPPLSSKHAVFWQVYEWIENVDKIAKAKTDENDKPEKEVKIISIDIKQMKNWELVDYSVDAKQLIEDYNKKKEQEKEANKNREVKSDDIISVNYTWKFENWEVFDSSLNPWRDPLEFQVWAWQVIPWFDSWVIWMKLGEKKTLEIEASDAYWEYDENNFQEVSMEDLKDFTDAGIKIEAWAEIPTQMWNLKIKEVSWDKVKIDTNHPLAWKKLIFEIELIDYNN